MNARKITALLFLFSLLSASADTLTFSAMGCGPYNADSEKAIPRFLKEMKAEGKSEFVVHLGDIVTGADAKLGKLKESHYSRIRDWFTAGGVPSYIVLGDNEWNDSLDPAEARGRWDKHLLNLDRRFEKPWETINQVERPENFAFVHKGVLVIGINLVGGRIHDEREWRTRFSQDLDWIGRLFKSQKDNVRAAVVLCQANPIGFGKKEAAVKKSFGTFVDPFGKLAADFEKPVLFLHADGHKWINDKPWKAAQNVTRVQLDLIASKFPPLEVTVLEKPEKGSLFAFDRRLP